MSFNGGVFAFELRGSHCDDDDRTILAFVIMDDQVLALSAGRAQSSDKGRHLGLVADRSDAKDLARAAGATILDRPFNILDPWGNYVEVVAYSDVQFSKTDEVLLGMGRTRALPATTAAT